MMDIYPFPTPAGRRGQEMSNLKSILLVEDNLRDAELTLTALEGHGLANEIIHVRDGAEALDYLYRRGPFANRVSADPAVVFLDLKMPKVDGLEVLKTIKSDEKLRSIPVVMLTSSREEADLVRSYKMGVNAYVVKPVDFQAFVDAVREVGAFWAVLNEPPPKSTSSPVS
jgi:CheY-like chemotaxis protein